MDEAIGRARAFEWRHATPRFPRRQAMRTGASAFSASAAAIDRMPRSAAQAAEAAWRRGSLILAASNQARQSR
jgi:hypothetical protein